MRHDPDAIPKNSHARIMMLEEALRVARDGLIEMRPTLQNIVFGSTGGERITPLAARRYKAGKRALENLESTLKQIDEILTGGGHDDSAGKAGSVDRSEPDSAAIPSTCKYCHGTGRAPMIFGGSLPCMAHEDAPVAQQEQGSEPVADEGKTTPVGSGVPCPSSDPTPPASRTHTDEPSKAKVQAGSAGGTSAPPSGRVGHYVSPFRDEHPVAVECESPVSEEQLNLWDRFLDAGERMRPHAIRRLIRDLRAAQARASSECDGCPIYEENAKLRAQLAEKDKEIERMKRECMELDVYKRLAEKEAECASAENAREAERAFSDKQIATLKTELADVEKDADQWYREKCELEAKLAAAEERGTHHCHAHKDGECTWEHCPQLRDGEPERSGRHCPLDALTNEREEWQEREEQLLERAERAEARVQEAESGIKAALEANGGPMDADETVDGHAYVLVRRDAFDALDTFLKPEENENS